jgi:hypothetical protein
MLLMMSKLIECSSAHTFMRTDFARSVSLPVETQTQAISSAVRQSLQQFDSAVQHDLHTS